MPEAEGGMESGGVGSGANELGMVKAAYSGHVGQLSIIAALRWLANQSAEEVRGDDTARWQWTTQIIDQAQSGGTFATTPKRNSKCRAEMD
jgi:hypothetical protein